MTPTHENAPAENASPTNAANEDDGRLSFDAAVMLATQQGHASFCAMPVFGESDDDTEQTAEGVRIFIVEALDGHAWQLRFIAGPFFSNAYAANERVAADEVPDSVRELRFLPTRIDEKYYDEQIQILVQQLVKGADLVTAQMPDYGSMPAHAADENVVFPISFIGKDGERIH